MLERERIIARPGFNRWLVPPAALAIHLCIGMAYGFSVLWLPLEGALEVTGTLFLVSLGSAAGLCGGWVERSGPRKAAIASAVCGSAGIAIAAIGVTTHQPWIMSLGAGVIGGIGIGLGYLSPMSTLITWFPDRRGMATGMAIMGFGAGAMIGAPLANLLVMRFQTPSSAGAWETLLVLAAVYFVCMTAGAFGYRLPQPGGYQQQVREAHTTQFWLIWAVLCLNVIAGIGIIGIASSMLQDIFGASAADAAEFTVLISLCSIGGGLFWASLSDRIGRKRTYVTLFILGIALYALMPTAAHSGSQAAFVVAMCLIVSVHGGGFATVPAYVADIFGSQSAGAIYGRVLTAWPAAAITAPVLMRYIRDKQRLIGFPWPVAYDNTMYILAAMLLFGLIANAFVRPAAAR